MPCVDETTLTLFVEDRLSGAQAKVDVEQHIDSCIECRKLVGMLVVGGNTQPASKDRSGPDLAGTIIDRYVTISELGAGAMGRVYLASDPELDRKVAIKLLRRVDPAGDHDARLRREAQALARVGHRNVAAIYDVGELDGTLFLAMEYVPNGTLSAWLKAEHRSWRDIVRVFASAGRGLAAVHAAGLVHRDFKPDNVLLDDAGEPKVTDFGLVHVLGEDLPRDPGEPSRRDASAVRTLTVTGAVLGTPAYMSPEQFDGTAIDARTDQFSFCVALFEALYRTRPFPGATVGEIRAALDGAPVEPGADLRRGVPRRIHRAIVRGLAVRPADRFAKMDELVAALAFDRRQRTRVAAGVALGGVALAAGAWFAMRPAGEPPCTSAAAELAEVWNPAQRDAVDRALRESHVPFASEVARTVITSLDHYADGWRASHTQVCEATRVHETQSVATMELRMTCLDARKRELASLVDVIATPSPTIVGAAGAGRSPSVSAIAEHAVDLVAGLSSLGRCDDVGALSGVAALPDDPAARHELDAAHTTVLRADVMIESGQLTEAAPLVDGLLATATRLHYAPLEIDAELVRGHLQSAQAKLTEAVATFQHAIAAADRSRDDRQRAWSWAKLIFTLERAGKVDEAESQLTVAQAAVDRAGLDVELSDEWDRTRAEVLHLRGSIAEAAKIYEAAIIRARARGDKRAVSELLNALVNSTADVVDPARTLPEQQESIAIATELYGAQHPQVARRERQLAHILLLEGKLPEAIVAVEHAFATLTAVYGPEHIDVAATEITLGSTLRGAGKLDEARAHLLHALQALRVSRGNAHYWVADALGSLALTERRAQHFAVALGYQREAHAILEKELGGDTDGLIASFHTTAMLERDLGKSKEAEASLLAGAALGERVAPANPRLALFYSELGSLRLEADDGIDAERWLERAVKQYAGSSASPVGLALMRLDLAHAKQLLGKWSEIAAIVEAALPSLEEPADITEARGLLALAARHGGPAQPAKPR